MEEKRQRSRSYPGYDLQECVELAALIRAGLGSGVHDRLALATAIGSTGLTGASTRKIAALAQFGLIVKASEGYSLSSLSERITRPVHDAERGEAIAEAFVQPDLYRDVLEGFQSDGRIPAMLSSILVRFHRIQDAAANDAARIFLDSGRYAGVIDEEGRIVKQSPLKEMPTATDRDDLRQDQAIDDPQGDLVGKIIDAIPSKSHPTMEQEFKWALTQGRTARLSVPVDLCANDIRLLKKQIEVLELQAELMEAMKTESKEIA